MPIIVVPDDEPSALAGTVEKEWLRQLGGVRIYDSRASGDEELLPRIAETSLALMLDIAHQIAKNDRTIRAGGWAREYSSQLHGKTLGVIGTGSVGQRMIQLSKVIGMKVIAWTLHPSPERAV